MKYTNEICNGCGRKFTDDDDIVVCPECGTPQHRECWLEEHKCVNEHLHEEGFEWKPKHTCEEKAGESLNAEKRACPFCGHENPIDAKECENCSQPFSMFGISVFPKENESEKRDSESPYAYKPPFEINYNENSENRYEPTPDRQSELGEKTFTFNTKVFENDVLGVPSKDFVSYIRANVSSYYKKFKRFENGSKLSFNFAAFIFSPFWFFFRKLYRTGIVFLSLLLCAVMLFYVPISQAMEDYSTLMTKVEEITASQEMDDSEKNQEINKLAMAFVQKDATVMYYFMGVVLLLNLTAALTADGLYKKKFLRDMNMINNSIGTDEKEQRYLLILRKGGMTVFAPIAAYMAMQGILWLLVEMFIE